MKNDNKTVFRGFKASEEESKLIDAAAEKKEVKPATWIRKCVVKESSRVMKGKK